MFKKKKRIISSIRDEGEVLGKEMDKPFEVYKSHD
jgi:hypothetical protein